MAVSFQRTLRQLRNTRDLRAEILSLAASLAGNNQSRGRMTVTAPVISEATVREEWERLLPAITPEVRKRMTLTIEPPSEPTAEGSAGYRIESRILPLERPNYRYEVLRSLLAGSLQDEGLSSTQALTREIGASQTPIRQALTELKQAGIVHTWGRGLELRAEDLSLELLAKVRALPQTLRFRFERGAQIKPPAALMQRAMPLLGPEAPPDWKALSLSGTPVAQQEAPALDLMGMPRLDLLARVPRDAKAFDTKLLRLLDDGLEIEPNVLAPAPVVVTLVRADLPSERDAGIDQVRCAHACDVFLSLLDMGLRDQALQYAKAVRP